MRALAAMRGLAATLALALVAAAPAPTPVRPTDGGAPWTTGETAQLRTAIDAQLAAAPTLRGAHVGIVAYDARDGSVLYAKNADDYVRPASTMKLLTGSFALDTLGASFRFTSRMSHDRNKLVFEAGNNPFLTSSDLVAAGSATAEQLQSQFATYGAGTLSFQSFFQANHWAPYRDGWTVDDFPYAYAGPIEPVIVDENAVRVTLPAGSSSPVAVPDVATVANPRCLSQSILVLREVPYRTAAEAYFDACGSLVLMFRRTDKVQTWHLAVPDPVAYASALIEKGMNGRGAFVPRTRDARGYFSYSGPGEQPYWSVMSPPLATALQRCWYPSDNLIAEKLLDEAVFVLRRRASVENPSTGTTGGAFAPELAWAKAKPGIALTDDRVADGSGMSQYDRLTANELAAILAYDWKSSNRSVVLDALPVAGVSGTLAEQYVGTPIAGRAFAKSGSMLHTSNLAGYLATKNHGTVIFAFMVDDWVGDDDDLLPLRGAILGRFVDAP